MDGVETEFLKTQERTPLVWFRYIDDIFFIWTHGKEHLETFLQELNNFNPDLKFTYESNEKEIPFLDLKVKLKRVKLVQISILNLQTDTNIYILHHILIIIRDQ